MNQNPLITKLLCVAFVASIMMPLGRAIFPHVAGVIGGVPFDAVEAVVSATIGFGIYAAVFG